MTIKYYRRAFLKDGLVNYSEENHSEVLLLPKETIDEALPSIRNKPLFIGHSSTEVAGDVVDSYYESERALYIVGFNTDSPEAQRLLDGQGWSVSCSYRIVERGSGGIYHDIHYDSEVLKLEFLNLALVENPRYQEAREQLNESTNFTNNSNITMEEEKTNGIGGSTDTITLQTLFDLLSSVDRKISLREEKLNESTTSPPHGEENSSIEDFLRSKGLTPEEIRRVEEYYRSQNTQENNGEPRTSDEREIEGDLKKEVENSSSLFRGEELQRQDHQTIGEIIIRADRIRASTEKYQLTQ
jgi:hypothetical protein